MTSHYFPPLEKCLSGDATLLSWRTAYRVLCDESSAVDNSHLQRFLADGETQSLLSIALDPFVKPTPRSSSEFARWTAPNTATAASNVDYSLDELKSDAQWLSREVQIEELAALRMVVVEWQERAADQLLNTAGNGLSLALSTSADLARSDAFNFSASTARGITRPALDFARDDTRHRRLLNVYLSEKSHVMKLSAHLIGRVALTTADVQGRDAGSLHSHVGRNWIDDVAATVSNVMCPTKGQVESEAFCVRCAEKVDVAIAGASSSDAWPKTFTEDDDKANTYVASLFGEIVSALSLLLSALHSLDGVPSATTVQAWFSVMDKYAFLQGEFPLFGDMSVPQALASVISVDMLKLQLVTGELMNAAGVETDPVKGSFYIKDEACLTSINLIFYHAAEMELSIAAPAIYAWSIITSTIQDIASIHREVRERRIDHSDDDLDNLVRTSSRRGSVEWQSEFEKMSALLRDHGLDENRDTPQLYFLNATVNHMSVFAVIAGLSNLASTFFSSDSESATAFAIKETLLDLLREGLPFVQYGGELLEAILSLIEQPVSSTTASSRQHARALASKFMSDHDLFRPHILDQALARYPYELSPLLRLLTAVSAAGGPSGSVAGAMQAKQILDNLQSFTQMVPDSFRSYELEHEDDNANQMQLTEAMPIFATRMELLSLNPSRRAITMGEPGPEQRGVWEIASGTPGVLVGERTPYVVKLQHDHSGLEYLGLLLAAFRASSEILPVAPGAELDRVTAAETITLFTAMLKAVQTEDTSSNDAKHLLGRLSNALQDGQDFVSVMAEVFETELLSHLEQVAQPGSLELVTACAEFLCVLVSISPERTWAMLARSSLLGVVDGASSLAAVVGGSEVQLGQYRFLAACVKLHSLLLENSITGLVKRKSQPARPAHRFALQADSSHSTSERTMSAVLNSYQKILIDALQSLPDWKFENACERCNIVIGMFTGFERLLRSTYGIHHGKEPLKRLTNVLAPSAASLLRTCVPEGGSSPLLNTFSRLLPDAMPVAGDDILVELRRLLLAQTNSLFSFLALLVRAAKGGLDLLATKQTKGEETTGESKASEKRAKSLSVGLLQSMPALASLLASDHAFKAELFPLLAELVQTVALGDDDAPSMLAQFDPDAAKAFLKVVTQLDRPLCDVIVERHIWDFLSVVMDSRQQWFAIYLLTGALPKKRGPRGDSEAIKGKPILSYALDQLSSISTLPPHRAVGMLKFVAVAQQTWVWATNELRSHPDFLKETLSWLNSLTAAPRNSPSAAALISARECEMASYLCEILAINLHTSLEIGDKSVLQVLVPKLTFLREHGVTVNAYNRSLHANLADNLKARFPQSELADFRRTEVNPAPLGNDYFYDRELAACVLGHDVSWSGAGPARMGRYSDEFCRANANLSLLHAQTVLLKSWKTLATTLCECADQHPALQKELALVAQQCLLSNASPQVDEPGAADVLKLRIELAFVITSKLVSLRCTDDAIKTLLPAAWELVRSSPVDYDIATAPEDVDYYRQLLQVLYLTIQPHNYIAKATSSSQDNHHEYLPPATSSILVQIVNKVIAPGFRALCANLHNDIHLALPADFALITALLQAVLAVPGISSVSRGLSDIIATSSVIRAALSLYSWSDQLGDDPIYGEISISFLLALSQIRPVATQMALEGILTTISSANLSNWLRKPGGKGPFDSPARMFGIWTEGFLPLCLNLLDTVGPPIAAEVAIFLNSFSEQLRRAEKALVNENPSQRNPRAGAVTLGIAMEANSLCLISSVLGSDMGRAAAEGISGDDVPELEYDAEGVRGMAQGLERGRRGLAERVVPVGALEERWIGVLVEGGENLLVGKVVRELEGLVRGGVSGA